MEIFLCVMSSNVYYKRIIGIGTPEVGSTISPTLTQDQVTGITVGVCLLIVVVGSIIIFLVVRRSRR